MLAQGASSGSGLIPLYYVTAIVVAVLSIIWGSYKWYTQRKKEWTDGGKHAAEQAAALQSNTEAAKANTETAKRNTMAIEQLTGELRNFVDESRRRFDHQDSVLADHAHRITRLENGRAPRPSRAKASLGP